MSVKSNKTNINPCSLHQKTLNERIESLQKLEAFVSFLRLVTIIFIIIAALLAWNGLGIIFWIMPIPSLILFIFLLSHHDRIFRLLRILRRQLIFTQRSTVVWNTGIDPEGPDGIIHVPEDHPSAFDLNLFGKCSLFSSVCIARTRQGHELLAKWLLDTSNVSEISERTESIKELRGEIDLRLQRVGFLPNSPNGIDFEDVSRWGVKNLPVITYQTLVFAIILALFNLATFALWSGFGYPLSFFLVGVILTTGFYGIHFKNLNLIFGPVRRKAEILGLLAASIKLTSEKHWKSLLLKQIAEEAGNSSFDSIRSLTTTINCWHARMNQLIAPFAFLILWDFIFARAIVVWHRKNGSQIPRWIHALAQFECLDSLAHHAFLFPQACFPDISSSHVPFIQAKNLSHPLIPSVNCIVNDVCLSPPLRFILISGSNMSGKSTYMRTIGINASLALAGGPVHASQMSLTPLRIVATLQIQDSLQEGLSRFGAELARLRQIVELSHSRPPLLFLLDEIFSGTNSRDRLAGARGLISELISRGGIGMVTTHDLALTEIPAKMQSQGTNGHFSERMENGSMVFDYKYRPGVVTGSNAQGLMRAIGIPLPVTEA